METGGYMRMGCLLASGTFWGVLLIFIGILLILKVLFNINIPVFRILFALLLIYFGIRILVGGTTCGLSHHEYFNEPHVAVNRGDDYRVVFGKGVIDLTTVSLSSGTVHKEIHTVFGNSLVKVSRQLPVKIVTEAAFGAVHMPDGNVISVGRYTYTTPAFKEGEKHLLVAANVVFGELTIVEEGEAKAP
jgi:hypothetical protein